MMASLPVSWTSWGAERSQKSASLRFQSTALMGLTWSWQESYSRFPFLFAINFWTKHKSPEFSSAVEASAAVLRDINMRECSQIISKQLEIFKLRSKYHFLWLILIIAQSINHMPLYQDEYINSRVHLTSKCLVVILVIRAAKVDFNWAAQTSKCLLVLQRRLLLSASCCSDIQDKCSSAILRNYIYSSAFFLFSLCIYLLILLSVRW